MARDIAPEPPDPDPDREPAPLPQAGSRAPGLSLADQELVDANLANVDARGAALGRVVLRRCRLTGLLATEGTLRDVLITECRVDLASFARRSLRAQRAARLHDRPASRRRQPACAAMPWSDVVACAGTLAGALGIRILDSD